MNKMLGILLVLSVVFFSANLAAYGGDKYGVKHHGGWKPQGDLSYDIKMEHSGDSSAIAETRGYGEDGYGESFTESEREVTSAVDLKATVFPDGSPCEGECEENKGQFHHKMESNDTAKARQWSADVFHSGAKSETEVYNTYEAEGSLDMDHD